VEGTGSKIAANCCGSLYTFLVGYMFCTVFGDLPALCDYLNEVSDVPTLSPVGAEPLKLVD
jgi:hypothetical protein